VGTTGAVQPAGSGGFFFFFFPSLSRAVQQEGPYRMVKMVLAGAFFFFFFFPFRPRRIGRSSTKREFPPFPGAGGGDEQ